MPGGTRKKAAPKDGLAASQRSLGRESSGGVNDVPGESAEAAQLLVLDELRATHAVVAFGGEGEKGRPLVGYVVHIRVADYRSGGENLCSWRVCRRYREFLKLRNAVHTAMEGAKPTKPAPNGKQPPGRRSGRVNNSNPNSTKHR
ncbi:hypothetical protein DIPPA_19329 [Diplonema papillatum]|nr:hypothetical protein DIPPA_19329 [Diplonema papillatum]